MRGRARLACGAVGALLAACATAPVSFRQAELGGVGAPRGAPTPGAPRVWIAKVEDGRSDATLGALFGRSFSSAEVSAWIDARMAAMASPGFVVVGGPAPAPEASLILRPRILKAYVDGQAMTKTAVIVLGVDVVGPDGAIARRLYRGQHASVNWATSEGEVAGALRDAAAACLEQLRVDVELRLHRGQPPARFEPISEAQNR